MYEQRFPSPSYLGLSIEDGSPSDRVIHAFGMINLGQYISEIPSCTISEGVEKKVNGYTSYCLEKQCLDNTPDIHLHIYHTD